MKKKDLMDALEVLTLAQEGCAPVALSIGSVTKAGQVEHLTLEITEAPSVAVEMLMSEGYSLSVERGTVRVEKW